MAGDWIKMRGNLWTDPRVLAICDHVDLDEAPVIGALYWLWATADQHSEDGFLPAMSGKAIDRKTGVKGFSDALEGIGWIECSPDGVRLCGFDEHNGASAKRRATDAKRKSSVRNLSASDADKKRISVELEREKELEKNINNTLSLDNSDHAQAPKTIPEYFAFTEEREFAAQTFFNFHQRKDISPEVEFFKFFEYYRSAGNRVSNWDAKWKLWFMKSIKFEKRG